MDSTSSSAVREASANQSSSRGLSFTSQEALFPVSFSSHDVSRHNLSSHHYHQGEGVSAASDSVCSSPPHAAASVAAPDSSLPGAMRQLDRARDGNLPADEASSHGTQHNSELQLEHQGREKQQQQQQQEKQHQGEATTISSRTTNHSRHSSSTSISSSSRSRRRTFFPEAPLPILDPNDAFLPHTSSIAMPASFMDNDANFDEICSACTGIYPNGCENASSSHVCEVHRRPGGSFSRKSSDLDGKGAKSSWGVTRWWFGKVIDPRTHRMKLWQRFVLLSVGLMLVVDPMFLYIRTFDDVMSCLYYEGEFIVTLCVLASFCDLVILANAFVSLRTAYVPREAVISGYGDMVMNAKQIAMHQFTLKGGIFLDFLAALPLSQTIVWFFPEIMPLTRMERPVVNSGFTLALGSVILLLIPKLIFTVRFVQRSHRAIGYIFGTASLGFLTNLAGYIIASQIFGAIWYLLATQQTIECFQMECLNAGPAACSLSWVRCPVPIAFGGQPHGAEQQARVLWGENQQLNENCFSDDGSFQYGIYGYAVQLMKGAGALQKIFYGLFFGIMSLSSFGNALVPTADFTETLFSNAVVISGLLLFVMLIGNIQVFLHAMTARIEEMQVRRRDLDWWMQRRGLPKSLQQTVQHQQRQQFVASRGLDEEELISNLPRSLRRDIKKHLSLDLVKKVPLFQLLDEPVLDHICLALEHNIFVQGTQIVRQGDPVQCMLFVTRGMLRSEHKMTSGAISTCVLSNSDFAGEELLSWGLGRAPDEESRPLSTSTLICMSTVEAFTLSAEDLRFVTSNFAFNLRGKKLRRWIRFYSPHWRTWAAVTIQLAWQRYRAGKRLLGKSGRESRGVLVSQTESSRMKIYAAIFSAPKPTSFAGSHRERDVSWRSLATDKSK